MSLTKTLTDRTDDNGRPVIEYAFDNEDGQWEGVLLTGPAKGSVTLADGTVYDVTPEVIEHLPGHAGPISHHIAKQLEATGQLRQIVDPQDLLADPELDANVRANLEAKLTHSCTEACGSEAE